MEILITGGAFFGGHTGSIFQGVDSCSRQYPRDRSTPDEGGFCRVSLLNSLVKIALLTGSLELGFVTGLISTDISAAVQGFRGFWTRQRRTTSSRPAHLR